MNSVTSLPRISRVTLAAALVLASTAYGEVPERPTFTRDVAPILNENCVSCHRPGEVAPMALRTFDEVRPWAKSIRQYVSERKMPPWFANPKYGTFSNDVRLTEDEIATIVAWVDQGARRGAPDDMPAAPAFNEGWQLGEPDYIVTLPEVKVSADGPDFFPDLSFTLDVPEKRWVRAVEVRPGNRAVTHHVVLFRSGGGMGGNGFFDVLAVWAVGSPPVEYAEGHGRWVEPGQRIITNMHYHPNGEAATDQTRVGLYFGEGELKKEITAALAGNMMFEIPPQAENHEITASWIVDQDIDVVSYFPHMHFRGKDMRFTATYPGGAQEILLDVPEYDFDWQLFYYPEEPIRLPKGTRIDILAHYDNSENNEDNPDPTRAVSFGVQSQDEMMFGLFEFVASEGVSPKAVSNASKIEALVSSLPSDEVFEVPLSLGGREVPTALHLPRTGNGAWYVPFMRQILTLSARDVKWDGNRFEFELLFKFGRMGGTYQVRGARTEDGNIVGKIESDGSSTVNIFPLSEFKGLRPGAPVETAETAG